MLKLLDHGQRLMAHLSLVRLSLSGTWTAHAGPALTDSLAQAHHALSHLLAHPAQATDEASHASQAAAGPGPWSDGLDALPFAAPELDGLPWLQRRLRVLQRDAQAVRQAALALSRPRT